MNRNPAPHAPRGASDDRVCAVTGETDLKQLLAGLRPELGPEVYVFCRLGDDVVHGAMPTVAPLATFREDDGLSLILDKPSAAEAGLERSGDFRRITLAVRSSLDAVGLTAAVSARLADAGIAANMVAAYHHDHVFVPADRAEEALALLRALTCGTDGRESRKKTREAWDRPVRLQQLKSGRRAGSEETP